MPRKPHHLGWGMEGVECGSHAQSSPVHHSFISTCSYLCPYNSSFSLLATLLISLLNAWPSLKKLNSAFPELCHPYTLCPAGSALSTLCILTATDFLRPRWLGYHHLLPYLFFWDFRVLHGPGFASSISSTSGTWYVINKCRRRGERLRE